MKPGDCLYLAFPDTVEWVVYVRDGTELNLKHPKHDPITYRVLSGPDMGDTGCCERSALYSTPLAAAIASAEMTRKLDEEMGR